MVWNLLIIREIFKGDYNAAAAAAARKLRRKQISALSGTLNYIVKMNIREGGDDFIIFNILNTKRLVNYMFHCIKHPKQLYFFSLELWKSYWVIVKHRNKKFYCVNTSYPMDNMLNRSAQTGPPNIWCQGLTITLCARCRDKKKGSDACIKTPPAPCAHCDDLTQEQKDQLATPSCKLKKEKKEAKSSTPLKESDTLSPTLEDPALVSVVGVVDGQSTSGVSGLSGPVEK